MCNLGKQLLRLFQAEAIFMSRCIVNPVRLLPLQRQCAIRRLASRLGDTLDADVMRDVGGLEGVGVLSHAVDAVRECHAVGIDRSGMIFSDDLGFPKLYFDKAVHFCPNSPCPYEMDFLPHSTVCRSLLLHHQALHGGQCERTMVQALA